MPLLSYLSGCATLVRLELGSFKFPLINFCADYRVTRNDNLLQRLPWTSWIVADEDPRVGLFRHPDIYLRSLAHLEHSLPLCQLQPQLIPPRATLTYWFPSPLLHTSACAAEHLCDTDSRSTSAAPDDKDLYQCPILFFEKRVRAGPANACSQEASNRSDKLTLISNADLKLLPTLEQLLRDYDPTVQHLDSFMARTFNFPALEELILKNCRYPVRELIDMGFIVRLVRHFTRFRESDAPDSPTHLRLVDLRDTDLFENYPELRLMSLLAPHIEFLADDEPPAPEEYY